MPIFIFLHILTMFIVVAMAYGPAMMILAARGHVPTLRGVMTANNRLQRLVAPTFGLGIAFGFVAVFVHGFDPLSPWLQPGSADARRVTPRGPHRRHGAQAAELTAAPRRTVAAA